MPVAWIITASEHDPWFNLALESYLVEQLAADVCQAVLYLWQNDQTVVIGRNQNAWAECLTGKLEAEGGRLARRSTGGGAVFHDLGNLNFSIILPRSRFNLDDNFAMILAAVSSQGIQAERSGRNDILAGGLKFSGNAFGLNRLTGLHHGTLLVHSDRERVARYLTVSSDTYKSKGVKSVRSRTTNLQSINPTVTVDGLMQAMQDAFVTFFAPQPDWQVCHMDDTAWRLAPDKRLAELIAHYASWDWRYGESLRFDAVASRSFGWGQFSLALQVDKGIVANAGAYSDALDSDLIACLPDMLKGCRFHTADLATRLDAGLWSEDTACQPFRRSEILNDIRALILEQSW